MNVAELLEILKDCNPGHYVRLRAMHDDGTYYCERLTAVYSPPLGGRLISLIGGNDDIYITVKHFIEILNNFNCRQEVFLDFPDSNDHLLKKSISRVIKLPELDCITLASSW